MDSPSKEAGALVGVVAVVVAMGVGAVVVACFLMDMQGGGPSCGL